MAVVLLDNGNLKAMAATDEEHDKKATDPWLLD